MKTSKIISLNVATPNCVSLDGGPKNILTGYIKKPILEAIFLDFLGFLGL